MPDTAIDSSVFVISDLHLGGAPGFQMCSARGRERLAAFISWCAEQHQPQRPVHLVIAGDIIDFLAEVPWRDFTADPQEARAKLVRVLADTKPVWQALRVLLGRGATLTLLLGNHDLELSLPEVRGLLLEHLGAGRVEFLYDGQALRLHSLLIDHGNRHDAWNVVQHDPLRRLRTAHSLGQPADEAFPAPAGSQLVARVMNELKRDCDFVDLLKPEGSAMLPLLAALRPSAFTDLDHLAGLARSALARPSAAAHKRWQTGVVSDPSADEDELRAALALARQIAGAPAAGATGAWSAITQALRDLSEQARRETLFQVLRFLAQRSAGSFRTDHEEERYRKPAEEAAQRLPKDGGMGPVVIYGHTHLARRVMLPGGGRYLNTGTWADLMYLPESLLGQDPAQARKDMGALLLALEQGQSEPLRRRIPSYARVDFAGSRIVDADVWLFRSAAKQERLQDGSLWSHAE